MTFLSDGKTASRPLSPYFAVLIAVLLTVPVYVGNIRHLPIIPQWFLSVLILFAFLRTIREPLNIAFMALAFAGFASIATANLVELDARFDWHTFFANMSELILWNLFALSFIFLGKMAADQWGLKRVARLLAISSAVFLVVITVPLIISGAPVRALSMIDGTASLNVHFLGLPIYATYGVNSLVPLFCIQAAIICASIYGTPKPIALLLAAGLACAVYLTVGSQNRASQLSLALLVVPICWILWHKLRWHRTVLIGIALCVAFVMLVTRGTSEHRLVTSLQEVSQSITGGESGNLSPHQEVKKIDTISTGRVTIWRFAFNEWLSHPIIGNGFSTFGRYGGDVPDDVKQNTTAHFYYLNELWKGGLIFIIPLVALIGIALRSAWASRGLGFAVERAFFACAIAMAFTFQSFVWDFLTLPSGGSLAWFLLGMMASREPHQA